MNYELSLQFRDLLGQVLPKYSIEYDYIRTCPAPRLLRTALAIVVAVLYFTSQLTGTAAVILGVLAVIFLVTSSVGFCPLYALLGISTLKGEAHEEAHTGAH